MKKAKKLFKKRLQFIAATILGLIALAVFFLSPETGGVLGVSLAAVPIWGLVKEGTFKELSPEQVSELEVEEQVKYFNELNIHRAEQLDKLKLEMKNNASDQIKLQIEELRATVKEETKTQLKALYDAINKQGVAITELMKNKSSVPSVKTLEQLLYDNEDKIKNAASEKVTIKTTVTTASITDSHFAHDIEGVGQLPTLPTKIKQLFSTGSVSEGQGGVVRYVDQETVTRAADWVAEAGVKPESAITWIVKTVPLETVADTIPVTNQALRDIPFMATEIRNFLLKNLALKVDGSLYGGDGIAPNITGVYTYATEFIAVASGVQDANIYDLIGYMKTDIIKGSDYMPNYILINPEDRQEFMTVKKDSNNNYVLPPFVEMRDGQMYVHGMLVVETSQVTKNTLLLGDFSYGTVYTIGGISIDIGLINDQFVRNMVTVRAEQALALIVRGVHEGAFSKETDIDAALTTLGTTPV